MYLPPVTSLLLVLFPSVCLSLSTPFVVQSLSSRAALVMGGYGPGYAEMKGAEVITHEGVCQGAISDVPSSPSGRYLGAESGLAETVGSEGDEVLFCRRRRCWRLNVKEDAWREAGGFTTDRDRAASAAVGSTMLVLGGRVATQEKEEGEEEEEEETENVSKARKTVGKVQGRILKKSNLRRAIGKKGNSKNKSEHSRTSVEEGATVSVEEYDLAEDRWRERPEWDMDIGRHSFCAVALNSTAVLVAGGYTSNGEGGGGGATAAAEVLDTESGRWQRIQDLPSPRYGHACLLMEWEGRPGVMAVGGALTSRDVVFLDSSTLRWEPFASDLPYSVDGHALALVEGVPVVLSWNRALAFDGEEWVHSPEMAPSGSRSAFAVASIPGHLVDVGKCKREEKEESEG